MIPQDPIMLLSYVNTRLRDEFSSLDELCNTIGIDKNELITKLESIDYVYYESQNQFK
ncbi:MAG: DUF4250 domain-containing protein [Bacteroidales bacterium]|nr:DUF4250 domain-containing protein [Bacteroidales bacterium]